MIYIYFIYIIYIPCRYRPPPYGEGGGTSTKRDGVGWGGMMRERGGGGGARDCGRATHLHAELDEEGGPEEELHDDKEAATGKQDADKITEYITKQMRERIMVIDGAMGTTVQQYKFTEEDFRGA